MKSIICVLIISFILTSSIGTAQNNICSNPNTINALTTLHHNSLLKELRFKFIIPYTSQFGFDSYLSQDYLNNFNYNLEYLETQIDSIINTASNLESYQCRGTIHTYQIDRYASSILTPLYTINDENLDKLCDVILSTISDTYAKLESENGMVIYYTVRTDRDGQSNLQLDGYK